MAEFAMVLLGCLYDHQKKVIEELKKHEKCLINMWCGTGKTRTFTIELFINNKNFNVIIFPSLGLINQYCNDYVLCSLEPFKTEFEKYKCLAFCSDDESKLKLKTNKIKYTTDEKSFNTFLKQKDNKIVLVTYQSFEKFINICIDKNININNLVFDESHHIVGDKIQNIVFNNESLDNIVDKTRFYTATPVNKNGITMYDRDNPENSDCGPLAYEYLYYQAVKDDICKCFETQISLYTQKPEYKDKYQPIFESIIRACLSGNYKYWNILTYHSFVNESEDMNEGVSFVKNFASAKNIKLVKKLFTKIQNEEFPRTKSLYSVEKVILKGVHSKTPNRNKIISEFDQKMEGRIYILSSCGILNEGIDTKWANMGVPINPSKSIVKESQRIGRLVRIPEKGMSPAIILIPCVVDTSKYSSMNTAEMRDQMIREELSECGNFNTALNVISAFKYQYDPELFEMCLKYPNMYAPKEVKDNLEKQGLIVEESQGNLIDNLSYVCKKEDITIDVESYNGHSDTKILNDIAKQCDKTIEIHTQNHNDPVKYINEKASDEEPLRLFYCEDDKTYAPIVRKNKKRRIKRKSTHPPKKRKPLFNIHTHPDLEVLWKIKKSSIDLNKTFSQGVLDVDINWNDKNWMKNYELLKILNKTPIYSYKTEGGLNLGWWCSTQKINKKKGKLSADKIKLLEKIPGWYWEQDFDQPWMRYYELLKTLNETPISSYKAEGGLNLGNWCTNQKTNKKKEKLSSDKIKLLEKIPGWYWEQDLDQLWVKNYELLKILNKTPAVSYKTECGLKLGKWCDNQKINKKKEKLSADKIKLLEKIPGWYWDSDQLWMEYYELLKILNETPLSSYKTEGGVKLGNWCTQQKTNKKKEKLSSDKIKLLEKIPGWYWDSDKLWMEKYELLKILNKTPAVSYKTECGVKLGMWCERQRYNKKKEKLSPDKIKLLEKIPGWYWERDLDQFWMEKYELLKLLNKTPVYSYKTEDGVKLGTWCDTQKTNKKKEKLSDDRIKLLEKIPGWYWEQDLDQLWMENYELLKILNKTPLQSYKTEGGVNLGNWCNVQRTNKKKGELSPDQIKLLEKIPGWYWEQDLDQLWMKNYELLKKLNETPLSSYKTEGGVKLGNWCTQQKTNKKKEKLSSDKIKLLEKIPGWYWDSDQLWMEKYELLKILNETPVYSYKTEDGVKLGNWCDTQKINKKNEKLSSDKIKLLEKIPGWYWEQDSDQLWMEKYELLKLLNETPITSYKTECGVNLGNWCSTQRINKKKGELSADKIKLLEKIPGWYWDSDQMWMNNYELLKTLNKIPSRSYKTEGGVSLGNWCNAQRVNKKKEKLSDDQIKLLEKIPGWYWIKRIKNKKTKPTKDMSKPEIKPKKTDTEIRGERQQRVQSELSKLHQEYIIKNSQNMNVYFKENPEKWQEYHKILKDNEESFLKDEIPRNKMIKYLEQLPGKKQKVIADLGCGFAEINQHFKDNSRLIFHNFDHQSSNDLVISRDIKNTELEDYSVDIAILSLVMWGSNCKEYISEVYRILDIGGTLLIAEPYKRWNKELDDEGNPINKLIKLLEENNFTVIKKNEHKFMFIECRKN